MTLGIVQTIWKAFLDLISSILTIDIIFYIGVGFLLLMSLFFFIKARTSYEYKLDKTADKLNDWLFTHQTITDQNLVEFNNIIKDRKSPKILRKYWQQYMLYRDKAPSEYMSTYNCIDKPLKTSSFSSSIKNFRMLYKITAIVTFFLSMFCFANSTRTDSGAILSYLTQSMVASILILFIGVVLTLALRAMQNYNIATLYQTFNVFNRYIDKASESIPKYVDFEILFTKQEIKDSIPILSEYLEKRARQEQEELEAAQRDAVSHEEYDFSKSGIDGSLVLERAMKESETYLNAKGRLEVEIKQFETEISTLNKNFENTSKDYQRKLQASKENLERLRQQQEESTNRIEVNYIRKQQQDEIKKQEQLEKDQDDATNKYNVEIKSLNEEIEKRKTEIQNKKLLVQESMLSEYQTFSTKLHKEISENVEKEKNESIQEANNEKEKYAQAITYLKSEVDTRDELIKSKDATIAELATKLQSFLGDQYLKQTSNQNENKDTSKQTQEASSETLQETSTETESTETDGHYDSRGYYWFNNGTYYDDKNLYHDLEGNVFDSDGNFIKSGEVVEKEIVEQSPKTEEIEESETIKTEPKEEIVSEVVKQTDKQQKNEISEKQDSEQNIIEQAQSKESENDQIESVSEEQIENVGQKNIEQESNNDESKQEPVIVDGKFDNSGNFTYPDGTYYDKDNLYHSDDGKVYNTEGVEVVNNNLEENQEEKPKRKVGRPRKEKPAEEQPKRKVGRPRKEKPAEEQPKRKVGRPKKEKPIEDNKPKRKVGRPKKVKDDTQEEEKPKRKVGRPKKVTSDQEENKPKRKAGRPKKETIVSNEEAKTKRKVGRPKKEKTAEELNKPKRKVGRPKKSESDQSTKLLQQLGQSLLNITSQNDEDNE